MNKELITYRNAIGKYQRLIKDKLASGKYIKNQQEGEAIKCNGYKIVSSKYNDKIYINIPKLLHNIVIEVAIDGDVIYTNKADRDTIHILTKRFNPEKHYSKLSVQLFNDLNKLSVMVKKRNGKSKLINGTAIILNEKDRQKGLISYVVRL